MSAGRDCPFHPHCDCPPGLADIRCPAIGPRAPLDHEPIRLVAPALFRPREFACLVAVALLGMALIWLGVR